MYKEGKPTETKEKFSPRLLIAGALICGVMLLVLGAVRGRATDKESGAGETGTVSSSEEAEAAKAWCAYLEGEAERLCASVSGISRVTVVVTLSGGFERLYAADESSEDGGFRASEYVRVGSGSSAHLCEVGVALPRIAGIGVSCRGASDDGIRAELTALLSAAFGVGPNKIYVTEAG